MPLPWLIGAAVVAAATALVKAVTDDSSSSTSSCSGEAARREQEREAELRRERQRIKTSIANLEKNQLAAAHNHVALAAEALGRSHAIMASVTVPQLDEALKAKTQARSEYAKAMRSALNIDEASKRGCTRKEIDSFLVNLQALDSLASIRHGALGGIIGSVYDDSSSSIKHHTWGAAAGSFFGNMREPDSLPSIAELSDSEREDLAALNDASSRLERFQRLKNNIEQQA